MILPAFQSTPPVKAATRTANAAHPQMRISIHAAREGGDFIQGLLALIGVISIHAAREGGDRSGRRSAKQGYNFNPRRP